MSRLEEARAELAAKKAALKALEDDAQANEELAAIERELKDVEAITKAYEKHAKSELGIVHTELGVVIVRRPHAAKYNRFRDEAKSTTDAFEKLVGGSIVHPSQTEFDALVEKLPAVLDRAANAVVDLAGFRETELAGKA